MIWGIVAAHPPMEGHEVDWKRLVRFVLLGSSDLERYAIPLVRVSLGMFFAISGTNKLFVANSRRSMYETLVQARVPVPHLLTYFVSAIEIVGGWLLNEAKIEPKNVQKLLRHSKFARRPPLLEGRFQSRQERRKSSCPQGRSLAS